MKLREEMAAVGLRERTQAADHELAEKHAHMKLRGEMTEFEVRERTQAIHHEQRFEQTESRGKSRSSEAERTYAEVLERMRLEMVTMHRQAQLDRERMDFR